MEAAASLSPLLNAVGSCHHNLHDVITSITPIWATEGFAERDREGAGDLGDLLVQRVTFESNWGEKDTA